MIAAVLAGTIIASSVRSSLKCPTAYSQISHFVYAASAADRPCQAKVAAILESQLGKIVRLDNVSYYFVLGRLADLRSQCNSSSSSAFRLQSGQIAAEGGKLLPEFHGWFEPMVQADAYVDSDQFNAAFLEFSKKLGSPNLIGTYDSRVLPLLTNGVKAGASGDFPRAEANFRAAFSHATKSYPIPEALYFWGLARAAQGKESLARATWCLGLRLVSFQHSDSRNEVNWNLLLAHRLSRY